VGSDGARTINDTTGRVYFIPRPHSDESNVNGIIRRRPGQVALGIFAIAGDSPMLCIGPERPAGFRASGFAALVVLERVRPGSNHEPA
jgi:hypothetical protein